MLTLKSILKASCQSWSNPIQLLYPKHWNKPTRLTCRSSNKEGKEGIETPLRLVEAVTWLSEAKFYGFIQYYHCCLTDLGLGTMSEWPLAFLLNLPRSTGRPGYWPENFQSQQRDHHYFSLFTFVFVHFTYTFGQQWIILYSSMNIFTIIKGLTY